MMGRGPASRLVRPVRAVVVGVVVLVGPAVTVTAATVTAGPVATQAVHADGQSQTWSVQPATAKGADGRAAFDYRLAPGKSVKDYAQVNNFGKKPLRLRVYSHDALNTPDGAFTLQPAAQPATEVGTWVGLDREVTIPAGKAVVVPFTLTVPADATPGDHAGGIVASVTTTGENDKGQQVVVDNRVGARIYLRVAGELNPALGVEQLDVHYERSWWKPFTSGEVTATYQVSNTGNVRLAGDQVATIAGPFGLAERTVSLEGLPEILPGQSITTKADLDSAAPMGRLTVDVIAEPGTPAEYATDNLAPQPGIADVTVWAIPWPELALLLLLILAIGLGRYRRRRRARRTEALIADAVAKTREQLHDELTHEETVTANQPSSDRIDEANTS